ncbi:ABC transporter permease [Streptomyces sp. NBC_01716]|uniref:ABC transporter permease n=1 Tax=Streptomyces sp. NBC_01716 TaxID=2975917 RepID=UPI002E331B51|nr:ABC transporter permease [Streptomyces sp. NBC_01716]
MAGSSGTDRSHGNGADGSTGGGGPEPARGGRPGIAERFAEFRNSPFLPALVILVIAAGIAGLFAGSYTYAMANPTPREIPIAVVGAPSTAQEAAFVSGMEKGLGASLELHPYGSGPAARRAVEEQRVFAILTFRPAGVGLAVVSAAGASVAELLAETAPHVARATGVPVRVTDIKPLQKGDPRGLALFYITLAAVIVGFLGALQLSIHAKELNPGERIGFIAASGLLGGFAIAAGVDWQLGAVNLPFAESWLILALTMFTSGMVFTMFNTLVGRWAVLPTWGLMVILGNPSSGGAVSWPLLPSLLGHVGRWLPPGASVNAQHAAVYFSDDQRAFPFLVLAGWALLATGVFWFLRDRHPGGRVSRSGAFNAMPG